jgi:nicotinamide-nucleotide amidase
MLGVTRTTRAAWGGEPRDGASYGGRGCRVRAGRACGIGYRNCGSTGCDRRQARGLVHFAAASRGGQWIDCERRYGDIGRAEVRRASVTQALAMLREIAEKE